MNSQQIYPIGISGQKWGDKEKQQWLNEQAIKRSYQDEVLTKIEELKSLFDIEQYGALSVNKERYPLLAIKTLDFDENKQTILVTGGVHGYETSGVQGALRFAKEHAERYSQFYNIIIAPCISPWGYETINRWNSKAIDPNRSFYANSPSEESAAIMAYIASLNIDLVAHFDLHETTDSDNSEFRPALAAREATVHDNWNIPDGFYLVGDSINPQSDFQKAIIQAVEKITHIAPEDGNGKLIGALVEQIGVINYEAKKLGLCMGFTDAKYVTTTEVYPDSPKVNVENCNIAQVSVITSGLDYILAQ
jgi:hypothetical protein